MSKLLIHPGIRVSKSSIHGFGVFTDIPIKRGDIIEQCPVILMENTNFNDLPIELQTNAFQWMFKDKKAPAMVLGWGMIYNHHNDNNVGNSGDVLDLLDGDTKEIMTYTALKDIEAGEELFVNYGPKYFNNFNITEKCY